MFGTEAKEAVSAPTVAALRIIILEASEYDQQLCLVQAKSSFSPADKSL
jgi:hypothetical protein